MAKFSLDLSRGRALEAQARGYNSEEMLAYFAEHVSTLGDLLNHDTDTMPSFVTEKMVRDLLSAWSDTKKAFFGHRAGPETGKGMVDALRRFSEGAPFPAAIEPEAGEAAPGALNPYDKRAVSRLFCGQTRLAGVLLSGVLKIFQSLKSKLPPAAVESLNWGDVLGSKDVPLEAVEAHLQVIWHETIKAIVLELQTYRPLRKRPGGDFSIGIHPLAIGAAGNG